MKQSDRVWSIRTILAVAVALCLTPGLPAANAAGPWYVSPVGSDAWRLKW
jgi:hypothetical protein